MVQRPLVLSGPSGSGKSTLLKKLLADFPSAFGFSVSHTTRQPRPGEEHGKDYHFTNKDDMSAAVESGDFIESAHFSGNLYGTSKKAVKDVQATGKICILDIDMQGVKSVKKTDLNAVFIFVRPPDAGTLEQRLRGRGTESEEAVVARLTQAKAEMEYADGAGTYDIQIINDDLDAAYAKLKCYVTKIYPTLKENSK
eukprot:Clim_evm19s134 gene=Clim_evmTU19s134